MIILTAGHTGPNTGAQCATTQFDEGAENIWLRNRVAEILTNKYGLVVLMDDDRASLKLLTQALSDDLSHTEDGLQSTDLTPPPYRHLPYKQGRNHEGAQHPKILPLFIGGVPEPTVLSRMAKNGGGGLLSVSSVQSVGDNHSERVTSVRSVSSVREKENAEASPASKSVEIQRALLTKSNSESLNPNGKKSFKSVQSVGDINSAWHAERNSVNQRSLSSWRENSVRDKNNSVSETTFLIDIHFNAHSNPNARGTEAIVANDATTLELRFASRLAHTTSDALDIPLRCIKSESETPHHRLAMLHLTPQSIILEVCFCTSPEDVEAYRKNREKLAAELAWAIAELILDRET